MAMYASGLVAMWSNAASDPDIFFEMIGPMRFSDTTAVLWSARLMGWSDDTFTFRVAAQFSKDGLTWESSLHYLDNAGDEVNVADEEWFYSEAFKSIAPSPAVYRFVRYGMEIGPEVGADREFVRGQLFIETRE